MIEPISIPQSKISLCPSIYHLQKMEYNCGAPLHHID